MGNQWLSQWLVVLCAGLLAACGLVAEPDDSPWRDSGGNHPTLPPPVVIDRIERPDAVTSPQPPSEAPTDLQRHAQAQALADDLAQLLALAVGDSEQLAQHLAISRGLQQQLSPEETANFYSQLSNALALVLPHLQNNLFGVGKLYQLGKREVVLDNGLVFEPTSIVLGKQGFTLPLAGSLNSTGELLGGQLIYEYDASDQSGQLSLRSIQHRLWSTGELLELDLDLVLVDSFDIEYFNKPLHVFQLKIASAGLDIELQDLKLWLPNQLDLGALSAQAMDPAEGLDVWDWLQMLGLKNSGLNMDIKDLKLSLPAQPSLVARALALHLPAMEQAPTYEDYQCLETSPAVCQAVAMQSSLAITGMGLDVADPDWQFDLHLQALVNGWWTTSLTQPSSRWLLSMQQADLERSSGSSQSPDFALSALGLSWEWQQQASAEWQQDLNAIFAFGETAQALYPHLALHLDSERWSFHRDGGGLLSQLIGQYADLQPLAAKLYVGDSRQGELQLADGLPVLRLTSSPTLPQVMLDYDLLALWRTYFPAQ